MAESGGWKKAINSVCDINLVKGRRLWSDRLGIPQSAPVDYHTFGRAIDFNVEVRQLLRATLNIQPMNHFRPRMPIAEIYQIASQEADAELQSIYIDADADLASFTDVSDHLAGQMDRDRRRVSTAKAKDEPEDEEDFDDIARSFD
jgi:hypothetical protein